ncbi:MAG: hypothetical protein AAGA30_20140, partial [Planctomycetota bacterium]
EVANKLRFSLNIEAALLESFCGNCPWIDVSEICIMKLFFSIILTQLLGLLVIPAIDSSQSIAQTDVLDNVTFQFIGSFNCNDLIFDRTRNLLYATVVSSQGGTYNNTITTFCPSDLTRLNSVFVGQEPGQLAISDDGNRVYFGLNENREIATWFPDTDVVSEPIPLTGLGNFNSAFPVDIAAVPGSPDKYVVSAGAVPNDGIVVFQGSKRIGESSVPVFGSDPRADGLAFANNTTLISHDPRTRGFAQWLFDGTNLELVNVVEELDPRSGQVDIEFDGTRVLSSNGFALDPLLLAGLGTYSRAGAIESIPSSNMTFIFQSSQLFLYDSETFLQLDSIGIVGASLNPRALTAAGDNQLAVIGDPNSGTLAGIGIIRGLPEFDAQSIEMLGDINLDCEISLADLFAFVELLASDGFQAEADINQDGVVDLLDVAPFVTLFSGG